LETLGVTVVGYQTNDFPGFFCVETGMGVTARADSPRDVAAIFRAQRRVSHPGALLVVQPPPRDIALTQHEVEAAVGAALQAARASNVRGSAMTPFLLSFVEMATEGRSLSVNLSLLEENARLAAAIALELGGSHS
jgi:pseudouridine-5'-phosphate glycosidase